jgi:hypothetical protein
VEILREGQMGLTFRPIENTGKTKNACQFSPALFAHLALFLHGFSDFYAL